MLESIYQPIVELGYSIQGSQFFTAYTIFVFSLGGLILYMFSRYVIITQRLSRELENPRSTYYAPKLSTREFQAMKLKQTHKQVNSLLKSQAYLQYKQDIQNQYSIINLRSRLLDTQIPNEEPIDDEEDQSNTMHQN